MAPKHTGKTVILHDIPPKLAAEIHRLVATYADPKPKKGKHQGNPLPAQDPRHNN